MDRQAQLKLCKKCTHKDFDPKKGIVCDLTGERADFNEHCSDFVLKEGESSPYKESLQTEIHYPYMDAGTYYQSSSIPVFTEAMLPLSGPVEKKQAVKRKKIQLGNISITVGLSLISVVFIRLVIISSAPGFSGILTACILSALILPPTLVICRYFFAKEIPSSHSRDFVMHSVFTGLSLLFYIFYTVVFSWDYAYLGMFILAFVSCNLAPGIFTIIICKKAIIRSRNNNYEN